MGQEWDHTINGLLRLAASTERVFETHPCIAQFGTSALFMAKYYSCGCCDRFPDPLIRWWTSGLFPLWACDDCSCCERACERGVGVCFQFSWADAEDWTFWP
ncbi:hypothetical protein H1C71_011670 [Ictidomys tridecemlineatus]|nr:hypothetical protein H1C71_011670 [Ictidomys tridecemlineatus]